MLSALLIAAQVTLIVSYSAFEPMVAFKCGRPAMHMTKHGWQQDIKTDCLTDPVDVLKYCRKTYSHMDITNALESSHDVIINNWCGKKTKRCTSTDAVRVKPFRCIVGRFNSDALLVPDGCRFRHIHDEKLCRPPRELQKVAGQRCAVDGWVLSSYEWLVPCGVDLVTGIEFVCCPPNTKDKKLNQEYAQNEVPSLSDEQFEENDIIASNTKKHKVVPKKGVPWDQYWSGSKTKAARKKVDMVAKQGKQDLYDRYISGRPLKSFYNEHDRFQSAVGVWEDGYHEKVTKLMKDWSDARDKVREMRHQDPKGAEKLYQTMQKRYQKTYDALKAEGDEGRDQLDRVHQQRVRKQLADKKKRTFDKFLDALAQPKQDEKEIVRALRHYINVEEKDKLHTLKRYQHILGLQTDAFVTERSLMPTHIKEINMRIEQSKEFVEAKVDKRLQKKILLSIQKHIDTFVDLDRSISKAILDPTSEKVSGKKRKVIPFKPDPLEKQVEEKQKLNEIESSENKLEGDETIVYDKEWKNRNLVDNDGQQIDDDWEDERSYKSNVANNQAELQPGLDSMKVTASGSHAGAIAGAVVGAAVLLLGAALIVRRYHRRRAPTVTHAFVEPTPEEQHVASMQAKGYENPTYKYFEQQGTA